MQEHVAHEGKNPYNGIKNVGIEPTTEVRSKEGETLSRSYELVQSKYSENMSVV